MRRLRLAEYATRRGVELTAEQLDALRRVARSITVEPARGASGSYDLTPSSYVGLVRVPGLAVEITPKLPVDRVMFLVSYALNRLELQGDEVAFAPAPDIVEAVVPVFAAQVRRATLRGLLPGYQTNEDALNVVRGRIRVDEQIRRHYGIAVPVEVRYDEFTHDTEPNRIIKAAIRRLARFPLRSAASRRTLGALHALFANVSDVEYVRGAVPSFPIDRLNAHYQSALALARLVLASSAIEIAAGDVVASAFLIDMNRVFEDFVVVGLREALGLTAYAFPQGANGRHLRLDSGGRIALHPDVSWWDGDRCVFVGDVKYKRTSVSGVPTPDLYQVLAYAIATGLPSALLVYAAGEADPGIYRVPGAEKLVEVAILDLQGHPRELLARISALADRVVSHRAGAAMSAIAPWRVETERQPATPR